MFAYQDSDPAAALPAYHSLIDAYHHAFANELVQIIDDLPLPPGGRVLDVACGDGFYARLLAARAGRGGRVVGLDTLREYLALARSQTNHDDTPDSPAATLEFVAGDINTLPFPPGAFDLVWCAQSLYSLPDPVTALARMREMARPGGVVAVLENDSLHDLILPLPAQVELQLRNAELSAHEQECAEEETCKEKFYAARNLWAIAQQAGLLPLKLRTYAFDRQAPLGAPEYEFLRRHLERLLERALPHLDRKDCARVRTLIDPQSGESLLHSPGLALTSLNTVLWGRRAG